jgi:glycerol uptake facilitator-like aquaporin
VDAVPLPRRLFAEFLGSAFLAATVIGSGIAAAQLSPSDVGLQLFENAAATATGVPAQVTGCIAGAVAANAMFALSAISISTHHRASPAHLFAEVVATLGLLLVIFSLARTRRGNLAPAAVGAYIGSAYFFTSSTSFATRQLT